jgi:PTH2 family peptidyl-tRNA hydrolase
MKQVIICRTDLKNKIGEKVRSGKISAQVAHASLKAILDCGVITSNNNLIIPLSEEMETWINGNYKKIVVGVGSKEELLAIYEVASEKFPNMPKALILDSGLTEFTEPTYTTVAIGPGDSGLIDSITGYLKLL